MPNTPNQQGLGDLLEGSGFTRRLFETLDAWRRAGEAVCSAARKVEKAAEAVALAVKEATP